MLHDINMWRARIGLYNGLSRYFKCKKCNEGNKSLFCFSFNIILLFLLLMILTQGLIICNKFCNVIFFCPTDVVFLLLAHYFSLRFLLFLSGDIQLNPGPSNKHKLSICHWNVNSITAHNFIKLSSLQAFNSTYNFDFICISESYLDSTYSSDDSSLVLKDYKLVRSDHPQNVKRGGVCIYYRESLPVKLLKISNLPECLILEIIYGHKKCSIVSLYRSPSQTPDDFDYFIKEFDCILDKISTPGNPNLLFILGDFNAKLNSWNIGDHDTEEGIEINALTSSYGLTQIISEPTHILQNSASCIDLIFTNQPNMVTKSGVYPSLHSNCHHQITYANIDFNIYFPPPYERQVWHYSRADIENIRLSIDNINWIMTFNNLNVDKQVELFNEYLMNIFNNFIPNEIITLNDKDPPWITNNIKNKTYEKNNLYKKYIQNGKKAQDFVLLQEASTLINDMISENKKAYYNRLSKKLSNPRTCPKAYWSILKTFFADKKIPIIPPLLDNGEFITNFKDKANLFNDYFSSQCSLIDNSSTLPEPIIPSFDFSISTFDIDGDHILKLIRSLDENKAHGFDQISIRMLKICDTSIIKPLVIIFKNSLNSGVFPLLWKKANVTPIHKKGDKCNVNNYRPISVLPICAKIYEKVIYNTLYNYFEANNILNENQSGFRAKDSCVNQLTSITHNIYQSFDSSPSLEVRGVFLDISKAFDRVWHDGVLFKLRSNRVEGNLYKLIKSFLSDRYQRVVLNGQYSEWAKIKAGVPQGSILGPLLFLIYINDLPNNLQSDAKLFADDTSIFSVVSDKHTSATILNDDLAYIQQWAYQWKMSFNPDESKQAKEVVFSRKLNKPIHPDISFNEVNVQKTEAQKHLGLVLDEKLNFNQHINNMINKATKGISILRKLRFYIPRSSLLTLYKSFIRSSLDYADVIYDQPNNASFSDKLEILQYNAALAITGAIRGTSREKLFNELGLEKLSSRRWFRRLCMFHKILKNQAPIYLYNLIPQSHQLFNLRNQNQIPHYFCRTDFFQNSFFPFTIQEWNKLDHGFLKDNSYNVFRSYLLKSIRPVPNSLFGACDPHGVKLLTRLRVGLSHLREHKFRHGFNDIIDPFCPCNMEFESVSHFFVRCHFFTHMRQNLMNDLSRTDARIQLYNDDLLTKTLLYGNKDFTDEVNSRILNLSIEFILKSGRFDGPLM